MAETISLHQSIDRHPIAYGNLDVRGTTEKDNRNLLRIPVDLIEIESESSSNDSDVERETSVCQSWEKFSNQLTTELVEDDELFRTVILQAFLTTGTNGPTG